MTLEKSPATAVDAAIAQAVAAVEHGDHDTALRCFEAALAAQPGHPAALEGKGTVLAGLGRLEEAATCFARALAAAPDDGYALFHRGVALAGLQRFAEAVPCFARVLQLEPDHFDALLCLGIALRNLHRYQEAETCLARAAELDGRHIAALLNRGLALGCLQRHREALDCFERILAIEPGHAKAMLNRSVALGKLDRHPEALASAAAAIALDPRDAGAHAHRGFELASLNRHQAALASLDRALAIDPRNADALEHRGFVCLGLGLLQEGFRARESRWDVPPLKGTRLQTAAPLWLGQEPLSGRRILLQHEQGFGDTIQFVRYAPLVARMGGQVILRVPAALQGLLARIPGVDRIVAEPAPPPEHDFYCPLMSLPLAFGTTLETIPDPVPYLTAEADPSERWRALLGPARGRPRIGIAWAGRQYGNVNSVRDMPLQELLPLLELDADFIALQKEIPAQDQPLLDTLPQIRRLGETLTDFADTAALIANLDLVIAVDTAVVHLAGAMGRPVWMMNRYASCWRWLLERGDSPWYPTLRIFRQRSFGDWAGVVRDVRLAALHGLIKAAPGA
ncbi:MAG: tetratricopeptide repeat-containing glycosyltransferase family protein [Nevskia sp.]|nr:tetratricopeptide repeat-containing glycosyltransferase family protein [Nevskia sp.]